MTVQQRRLPPVLLFTICSFGFTTIFWMILSFLPIHLKNSGIADASIGAIIGTYSISALLLMIPLGLLSDRFNPRTVLIFGSIVTWVHVAGLRTAGSVPQFLLFATLGGIGWSVFQIVLYAHFLKVIGDRKQGISIAIFHSGQFLGYGIGPLIAGTLWGLFDFTQILTVVLAGALLLNALVFALPGATPIRLDWRGYGEDLRQGRTALFLFIYFIFAVHYGVEQAGLTLFMSSELMFNVTHIGFSYFSTGVWMAFLSPFAGRLFDSRFSYFKLLAFGLVVSSIFQLWTGWINSLEGMIFIRILHTLGDTPAIIALGVMTAAFFPSRRLGGNSAMIYVVRTVGTFAGTLLTGLAAPVIGYGSTFVYNGAFILLITVCLFPLMQKLFEPNLEKEAVAAL